MTRKLPDFIDMRRDPAMSSAVVGTRWRLTCKACGLREWYEIFWDMAAAAFDHADWHNQAQDEMRAGA